MHYAQFKQNDPIVLEALIRAFPLATIAINGSASPEIAYAPVLYKPVSQALGALEFHLAMANPVTSWLGGDARVTLSFHGPSAPVSPSWYTARFAGESPDRSKTAPTYDYVHASVKGAVSVMSDEALRTQIEDLVKAMEPANGWKLSEIDADTFRLWRTHIRGFSVSIESFDLTAKVSQEQNLADRKGVCDGLRKRGRLSDAALCRLIEQFDGTPESMVRGLAALANKG